MEDRTTPTELVGFNYGTLEGDGRDEVKRHADAIRILLTRTAQNIVEVGRRIRGVHRLVGPRHFKGWLKPEFHSSNRVAYGFMSVAEKFDGVDCIQRFDTSALLFLAGRSVNGKAVTEAVERAQQGEYISVKKAAEIRDKHRVAPVPASQPDLMSGFRDYVRRLADRLGRRFVAQQLVDLAAELQNEEPAEEEGVVTSTAR